MFDDAAAFLSKVEDLNERRMNSRTKLTGQAINDLKRDFPGVPEDFLDYLREIGAGSFRECQFIVYGFLSPPEQILGPRVFDWIDPGVRVLCFGDNFSGDLSGFLPDSGWAIVELWHDSRTLYEVDKSFSKYIREKMLIGPSGEDLSAS